MRQEEDFDANLAGEDGTTGESKKSWFKRIKKGILTSTAEKNPEGSGANALNADIFTVNELREPYGSNATTTIALEL
jgi:acetyl-CoA carboxylase carboxyl transferase subunit beta